ncbi:MAG: DUF4907 domain-containing protein [Bacteroidetes bacterium]|nr:hypothetical protein [Flavobacteriales bacterium]MCL4816613.1 DUF4907 domain-containing protein [Flavobacteriales bacterium]NOG95658.1 DUF4907 domain-containing protein [Bacteroidota bacterium]WKZ75841.1 MAG: DUF4907 domain-containing protein [Vicingaceae bacterium]CAG0998539.1 hypothetical protein FLAV_02781 [Flavobacteriales bacterium]
MANYIFFFTLSVVLLSCTENEVKETIETNATEAKNIQPSDSVLDLSKISPQYSVEVFNANENEFGYDILVNGMKYIHQPHIPAIEGMEGFKSKKDAEKTAALMIEKIKNNIIPPTISKAELDSLGVLIYIKK